MLGKAAVNSVEINKNIVEATVGRPIRADHIKFFHRIIGGESGRPTANNVSPPIVLQSSEDDRF